MVFFLPLLALAATAASAAMSVSQARNAAAVGQRMSDWNNKEVLLNYRRNLEKLSDGRVETRRIALGQQANVNRTYRGITRNFQASFADNWGQSAHLFAQSIARRQGEDAEQIEQNLDTQLQVSRDQAEELRLGVRSQLTTPPPDQTKSAILSGVISVGFQALQLPSDIKIAKANQKISDWQTGKADAFNATNRGIVTDGQRILTSSSVRVTQFNSFGNQIGGGFRA